MLKLQKPAARGFTLVELMVGLVVGMIVVAGVTSVYIANIRGSSMTLRSAKLNDELRAVANVMTNDIRRAGHIDLQSAAISTGFDNAFANRTAASGTITDISIYSYNDSTPNQANCVVFTHDATFKTGNTVGTLDNTTTNAGDMFGYRLNPTTHAIEMLTGVTATADTTSCATGKTWEAITTPQAVVIDSLTFSTGQTTGGNVIGSRCLDTTKTPTKMWIAAAGSIQPACTFETGKRTLIVNSTPPTTGTGASTDFSSGDILLESRQISIDISGHHASDPNTVLTVHEDVKLMNDRKVTQP